MPRFEVTTTVTATVRKDGYGQEEVITDLVVTAESYYSTIDVSLSFLEEGETYYIEFTHEGKLWYRDKIYATSQTDYKVKHKQSQNNYEQYNELDDNTYIIRN
jgi:hypothetical protein